MNDSIVGAGGQTLTNTAAYTPYYVNRAWQMLQQELLNMGYARLIVRNYLIAALAAVTTEDTSVQVTLDWTGYFDGTSLHSTQALPQNAIRPIKLTERLNDASPNLNLFWDMSGPDHGVDGVPLIQKDFRNRIWSWQNDQIQMPGATSITDLAIDYAAFLADFTTGSFPGSQVVPIMRSTDALAWAIGYGFSYARNDDPAVCSFAHDQFLRAAAIIAGAKLPTETVQAVQ